jgi:hypothetical protein
MTAEVGAMASTVDGLPAAAPAERKPFHAYA